jgi:NAD(P)-dependent dehydrogenase (short-subunit alcohol dehydrogenase family)
MTRLLQDQTVLVIGRASGFARAIALAARDAGARVVAAGRNQEALPAAYADEAGISTDYVDLTDDHTIASLSERLGTVDHVVSTGSARARGHLGDLDREAVRLSSDTKVIGPLMIAKHFAPLMTNGGSFVIFSGVAATKITVGTMAVAITNAAADTLARSLALELAPICTQNRNQRAGVVCSVVSPSHVAAGSGPGLSRPRARAGRSPRWNRRSRLPCRPG